MSQFLPDCLNKIFEYLEDDKNTLRSCLLVNHHWCEVSVRILWRSIGNYNTLIACLPDNSKEIYSKNGNITLTSASSPPTFNYASFCKVLSTCQFNEKILKLLQYRNNDNISKVTQEIFKFLIAQTSLREVDLTYTSFDISSKEFTTIPGVTGYLGNLSKLSCNSDICSEFFYQLSQTCHNIQSLNIRFVKVISNGLADLVSIQRNLKILDIYSTLYDDNNYLAASITSSLTNIPIKLSKLVIEFDEIQLPSSVVAKLIYIRELTLVFDNQRLLEGFDELKYSKFLNLQVLKFKNSCPRDELLIKFLENNGENLKEIYANYGINNSVNLAIANFCQSLRKIFTGFKNNEAGTLKMILNNCQYLESIKVWCCNDYLNEKELFEVLVEYSPESFHELKLCYYDRDVFGVESKLLPEELESFLISWSDRIPESLSLIIFRNTELNITLDKIDDNMEIIEKYTELGIIREFRNIKHYSNDFEY